MKNLWTFGADPPNTGEVMRRCTWVIWACVAIKAACTVIVLIKRLA